MRFAPNVGNLLALFFFFFVFFSHVPSARQTENLRAPAPPPPPPPTPSASGDKGRPNSPAPVLAVPGNLQGPGRGSAAADRPGGRVPWFRRSTPIRKAAQGGGPRRRGDGQGNRREAQGGFGEKYKALLDVLKAKLPDVKTFGSRPGSRRVAAVLVADEHAMSAHAGAPAAADGPGRRSPAVQGVSWRSTPITRRCRP